MLALSRASKLHSISPTQTFRFSSFPQHRNKSIWHFLPSLWADSAFERRRTHSYSGNPYSTRLAVFFAKLVRSSYPSRRPFPAFSGAERLKLTISQSVRCDPKRKLSMGTSLPRTSRFNDDTESAEFLRYLTILSNSVELVSSAESESIKSLAQS